MTCLVCRRWTRRTETVLRVCASYRAGLCGTPYLLARGSDAAA